MTKTPKTTAITIQEEPGRLLSAGTRGSPMVRHFPFAASKVVILADLCSRSKSARRFWPECLRLNAQSDPFPRVGALWRAFARCTAQHQPAFGWDRHAICSFATVICAAATAAHFSHWVLRISVLPMRTFSRSLQVVSFRHFHRSPRLGIRRIQDTDSRTKC